MDGGGRGEVPETLHDERDTALESGDGGRGCVRTSRESTLEPLVEESPGDPSSRKSRLTEGESRTKKNPVKKTIHK